MANNVLLRRHDGRRMSRSRIGPKQKKEIRKSAHNRAIVCSRSIMPAPVFVEACAVLTLDPCLGHEHVCLEPGCQNDDMRGHEVIGGEEAVW